MILNLDDGSSKDCMNYRNAWQSSGRPPVLANRNRIGLARLAVTLNPNPFTVVCTVILTLRSKLSLFSFKITCLSNVIPFRNFLCDIFIISVMR